MQRRASAMKEDRSLCERTFSYYSLRRCYRCKKMYCRDCITYTRDGDIICLNCARRLVSPKIRGSKYSPLRRYLTRKAQYADHVTLPFAKIEEIIDDNLPFSATHHRNWWSTQSSPQAQAWLGVKWKVHDVNLEHETVTFRREGLIKKKTRRKRKKATSAFMDKTFRPTKPRRLREPSKTKIARAQARLSNVERRWSSMRQYRGKFKPKSAYEKRLYKPDAKPSKTEE